MAVEEDEIGRVLELERELQTKGCRSDPGRLRTVLAPESREIGASGRVWDREAMIDHLQTEGLKMPEIGITALSGRRLVDDLILVTWVSDRAGRRRRAWRTSLWRSAANGGQLVHHQGTPIR